MHNQPHDHQDHQNENHNPFAPREPIEATAGERIARYAVWIAFIGASVAGIWFARS